MRMIPSIADRWPDSRISRTLLPSLFAVAFSSLLGGISAAGTIVVKKGGNHPTINDGVAAAGSGDTVLVRNGVYQENVSIPAGKNGLKLIADGKVIVEARPAGGSGKGPGIRVDSEDVMITGFVIRNAALDPNAPFYEGYGIWCLKDGLTVKNCVVTGCGSRAVLAAPSHRVTIQHCEFAGNQGGLRIDGDQARVIRTTVRNDNGDGITVVGDGAKIIRCAALVTRTNALGVYGENATLQKNAVRDSDRHGILVDGGNATIQNNVVENVADDGLNLTSGTGSKVKDNTIRNTHENGIFVGLSSDVQVTGNRLEATRLYGIDITGSEHTISGNTIRNAVDYAIDVAGSGMLIEGNQIERVYGYGVYVDGDDFTVRGNTIRDCTVDYEAIYIGGDAVVGLIEDNRVFNSAGAGIYINSLQSSGIVIARNTIRETCLGGDDAGIVLRGSNHEIRDNTIRDCGGDGILVEGDSNLVKDNLVKGCARDGVDVEIGAGNTVLRNQVIGCGAEGLENNGTSTTVTNNRLRGNRIDLANDGTGTPSGNDYATGGWGTAPEID